MDDRTLRIAGVTRGAGEDGPQDRVLERLDYTVRRDIRKSPANMARILELDTRWKALFYDEFRRRYYLQPPGVNQALPMDDRQLRRVMRWVDDIYGVDFSKDKALEGVLMAADRASINPLQDYLLGLSPRPKTKHRGPRVNTDRIDGFLAEYLGAPRDGDLGHLVRKISRCFLISAVARAMDPGCKVDTVLILVGSQGLGKSTGIRALFGDDYFKDTSLDLSSPDARRAIASGVWGYELGELDSFSKKEWGTIKAFLSAQEDYVRMSYGKFHETYKRQLVFVGTSNKEAILSDPTGSRRFWPIKVSGPIDPLAIARKRDALWKEAMDAYWSGEPWWLDHNAAADLIEHNETFTDADPWAGPVELFLSEALGAAGKPLRFITPGKLLRAAVGLDLDRVGRREGYRLSAIMKSLGWISGRGMEDGKRLRGYLWTVDAEFVQERNNLEL